MSETEIYIFDQIKAWVWSGFYDEDEVSEMMDDILEDDADEELLRSLIGPEFAKKLAAEKDWPQQTDCDRLDYAFELLNSKGIVALHNTGATISDGLADVAEVLHERGRDNFQRYCFYHGQDVDRAVTDGGLRFAFGDLCDDEAKCIEIGNIVKQELENVGFQVKWNGDPKTRLCIPDFDWKRRRAGQE